MARHDTRRRWFCKQLRLWMALLCVMLASATHAEQSTELYTIPDIQVNETAEDAGKARKIALDKAQSHAFVMLIERLVPERLRQNAPVLSDTETASLVQAIEVNEEKISSTTYQAKVVIRFYPDKVRALLKAKQIEFAEKIAPLTLVIPILQDHNQVYLWEPENLWRIEWNKRASVSWVVPLVVPAGDLEDIRVLSTRDVMLGDFTSVVDLAGRYHAEEAIVMEALVEQQNAEAPPVLNLLLKFLKGKRVKMEKNIYIEGEEGQDRAALFEKAATAAVRLLEEQWKSQVEGKMPSLDTSELEVKAPFSGLTEWVEIKKRVENVKTIKKMEILSLAADHARIMIRYDGDRVEEFAMQLLAAGLALRQGAFGEWELHLLGGGQ